MKTKWPGETPGHIFIKKVSYLCRRSEPILTSSIAMILMKGSEPGDSYPGSDPQEKERAPGAGFGACTRPASGKRRKPTSYLQILLLILRNGDRLTEIVPLHDLATELS